MKISLPETPSTRRIQPRGSSPEASRRGGLSAALAGLFRGQRGKPSSTRRPGAKAQAPGSDAMLVL